MAIYLNTNDIVISILLISVLSSMVFIFWYRYIKKWIFVKILNKYSDNIYEIIKTKRINPNKRDFNFSDYKYIIDIRKSILDKRKRPNIYYEKDSPEPISFIQTDKKIDSKFFKDVVSSNIWGQLLGKGYDDLLMYITLIVSIAILAFLVLIYYNDTKLIETLSNIIEMIGGNQVG